MLKVSRECARELGYQVSMLHVVDSRILSWFPVAVVCGAGLCNARSVASVISVVPVPQGLVALEFGRSSMKSCQKKT
jgi:hypothetical protein